MRPKIIDYEQIYRFSINYPDYRHKDIAEYFKISINSVDKILKQQRLKERKIYVVVSLSCENTFYVFDDIIERKFIVDANGFVFSNKKFNSHEIEYLETLGFKFKAKVYE